VHGEDGWQSMRDVDVRAANSFRLSFLPFISPFHFHPFIFILLRPSFPRTFPALSIYAQCMLNICSIYAQYMLMLTTPYFYRENHPRKGVDFLCLVPIPVGFLFAFIMWEIIPQTAAAFFCRRRTFNFCQLSLRNLTHPTK